MNKINVYNMDIDKLKQILLDSEWVPNESVRNKSKWKKLDNYFVYLKPPKIEYEINQDLINLMKKYNELFKKNNFIPDVVRSKTTKIFKIYDDNNVSYGSTNMSIMRYIKSNLQRYLRKIETPFNIFNDIMKIKFKLIMVVHGANRKDINDIKKRLSEHIVIEKIDEYIKIYDEIIKKFIKKFNIKKKIAYVYALKNTTNNKTYIGVSSREIDKNNKDKLIEHLSKTHKNIKKRSYDIKILCKIKYSSNIGLLLIVDKYIVMYNSIKNGYNKTFRFVNRLNDNITQIKDKIEKAVVDDINSNYDK